MSHLTRNELFLMLILPFFSLVKFVDNFLCIAADRQIDVAKNSIHYH